MVAETSTPGEKALEAYLRERGLKYEREYRRPGRHHERGPDFLVRTDPPFVCEVKDIESQWETELLLANFGEAVMVPTDVSLGAQGRRVQDGFEQLASYADEFPTVLALYAPPLGPDLSQLNMLDLLLGEEVIGIETGTSYRVPQAPHSGIFRLPDNRRFRTRCGFLSAVAVIARDGRRIELYLNPHTEARPLSEAVVGPDDVVWGVRDGCYQQLRAGR